MTEQTQTRRSKTLPDPKLRIPDWFKQSVGKRKATENLSKMLETTVPNTICQEAKCPNRSDCFNKGIMTFMVMGTICTRNCAFCSVSHGKPLPPSLKDLDDILNAIEKVKLKFVVLTSPNRDDLPDGGASHYAALVRGIRAEHPNLKVEVLIPDFQGNQESLQKVVDARPDVINHNMETVPSLYTIARRGSLFKRSLEVLSSVKEMDPSILTKSGVMVGLGESWAELLETFKTIQTAGVDILTIGQYLKPDKDNLNVQKYYTPEEFDQLREAALSYGYKYVFSGPLVRSSYLAEHVFNDTLERITH